MSLPAWHNAIWLGLRQRLAQGALPHAILLAGAAGLGKRELATRLARAVLCQHSADGEPCGQCRACQLLATGTHPDLHPLNLELNTQGNLRQEIVVAQVRAMSQQLSMTSQLGGRQIALIDPADRLNRQAANALLKTLEEPARDTVIVLVADQPWRLPATVRSRCQIFTVHQPARELALAWLSEQGLDQAETALEAAGGNPGLALKWQREELLPLFREVEADLRALSAEKAAALEVCSRWSDENAAQRLWFAARLAADEMKRRTGNRVDKPLSRLDDVYLRDWYHAASHAREDLRSTLRPALVLFPVLATWR